MKTIINNYDENIWFIVAFEEEFKSDKHNILYIEDAGKITQKLYNALLKQYQNPDSPESLKSLNMLCVRLVFCLYADYTEVETMPKKSLKYCRSNSLPMNLSA